MIESSARAARPSSSRRTLFRSTLPPTPVTWGKPASQQPAQLHPISSLFFFSSSSSFSRGDRAARRRRRLTPSVLSSNSILSNHVASVESLKPGMLEVFEGTGPESKKWFGAFVALLSFASRRSSRTCDAMANIQRIRFSSSVLEVQEITEREEERVGPFEFGWSKSEDERCDCMHAWLELPSCSY